MIDRKVTHFADGFPLAYINRLERELAEAKKDTARLDWLADVENRIGNVILPRSIVEQNLDSMRHAIDATMEAGE